MDINKIVLLALIGDSCTL